MSTADVCAVILWVGVTLYAIFGGATSGPVSGTCSPAAGRERSAFAGEIDRSIGPVWKPTTSG